MFGILLLTVSDFGTSAAEMCVEMGTVGIPWVLWDSHGNGSDSISWSPLSGGR